MTSAFYRDIGALYEMLSALPSGFADPLKQQLETLLADASAKVDGAGGNPGLRGLISQVHDAQEEFLTAAGPPVTDVGKGLRAAGLADTADGSCSLLERLWAEQEDGVKSDVQFISDLRAAFGRSGPANPTRLKKYVAQAQTAGAQVEVFCDVMKRQFPAGGPMLVGSAIDALLGAAEQNGLDGQYVDVLRNIRKSIKSAGGGGEGSSYWPSTYVSSSSSSSSSSGG